MTVDIAPEARFRVRLRVRFSKGLTTEDTKRTFEFGGVPVDLTPQGKDETLSNAKWFLLCAGGFKTGDEAYRYGNDLRQALIVAGLASRLGVDAGSDLPTTQVNEDFFRSLGFLAPDERLAPNVHGLIVIPDNGKTKFPVINAEGRVTAAPDQVIGAMEELRAVPALSPALREALIIMNMAIINTQPIAQLALAISTVEGLAQDQKWSDSQRTLIKQLAAQAEAASAFDSIERNEVADAMVRTLHRIGLRQGVIRVLRKLDLFHLRKEWDRIYSARSGLFHGTDRPENVAELANEAVILCGTIVLTLAKHEGLTLPEIATTHFPALKPLEAATSG